MTSDGREPSFGGFPEVAFERWRQEVERGLEGADFDRRLVTRTLEGIDVQPLYTDAALADAGLPGVAPYRRGTQAVPRAGDAWDMRARFDQPDPARLRAELTSDLGREARSLWLVLDGDARMGRASPVAPRTEGERGIACLSARQLGEVLSGVDLSAVALALDAGGNALPAAACLLAAAEARGLGPAQLSASFDADPLGALAQDGSLPHSIDTARVQMIALARYCAEQASSMRAVTVSVVPYHDGGASAVQELGYALATGAVYLRWLVDGGLSVDAAAGQIGFRVAIGGDFFMEVAKLRALRQAWAGLVGACGGSTEAQRAVVHAVTSSRTKTARDPWVNMLRETTEAFAAALGGADAITTRGFDRRLGVSDAFARRIAGNVQVILNEEAHVTRVADPGGGAYYVEQLTEQLARGAWALLQAIEHEGDFVTALCTGRVQAEVAAVAAERVAAFATRKQAITGVSEFAHVAEQAVVRKEPAWAAVDAARVAALAAAAHDGAVLEAVAQARAAGRGLVEAAIEAARQGATLAQLSDAARASGPAAKVERIPLRPHAEAFERLRDASDARAARGGRPKVFSCNLGPIPEHMARAQFASGFFAAGGFEVIGNDGLADPGAAVPAFRASGAELCVICGSDAAYPELAPSMAEALVAAGAERVLLAGRPRDAELEQRYRRAGVSDFIFAGCDLLKTLRELLGLGGGP